MSKWTVFAELAAAARPWKKKPRKSSRRSKAVDRWRETIKRLHRKKGAGPTAIHDWLRLSKPEYQGSLSAVKRMCQHLPRRRRHPSTTCTTKSSSIVAGW